MNDNNDDTKTENEKVQDGYAEADLTATEKPPVLLTDRINSVMGISQLQYEKLFESEPMNSAWPLIHNLLQATNDLNFLVSKQGEIIMKLDAELTHAKATPLVGVNGQKITSISR